MLNSKIIIQPGLLLGDHGRRFGVWATRGAAPLGELLQWSDVIASLFTLGHRVILSTDVTKTVK